MNSDACRSGVAPSLPAQAALSCLPESALSAASKAARSRFEVAPDPRTAKRRETSAEGMTPSGARRWCTYLTLFIAVAALVGDGISLLYNLLGGELTIHFVLKSLVVGGIAASALIYYLRDLRHEEKEDA